MGPIFFLIWLLISRPLDALTINFRFLDVAMRSDPRKVAKGLFNHLVTASRYDDMLFLLDNPHLSLNHAYNEVCTKYPISTVQNIIAHFTDKPLHLKLLLPPDCIISCFSEVKKHPEIISSLPYSLLESNLPCNLKSTENSLHLRFSVERALAFPSPHIKFVHLTESSVNSRKFLSLQDAFPVERILERMRNDFMFRITPEFIKLANDTDLKWLIELSAPVGSIDAVISSGDPVSFLNLQLFRLISLLSVKRRVSIRLNRLKKAAAENESDARRFADRIKLFEGFATRIDSIEKAFFNNFKSVLTRSTDCERFKKAREVIYSVLTHFVPHFETEERIISKKNFNGPKFMFRTITDRYANCGGPADWMLNLLALFGRKTHQLRPQDLDRFIIVFLSKKPTFSALHQIRVLFSNYNIPHSIFFTQMTVKEKTDLYLADPSMLSLEAVLQIPFKVRAKRCFKSARTSALETFRIGREVALKIPSFELVSTELARPEADKQTIWTFFERVLKAPNSRAPQKANLGLSAIVRADTGRGSPVKRTIIEYLQVFFTLFMEHNDLFFALPEASHCGRLQIIISPLITPYIAHILGECMTLAMLARFPIPFVLERGHFNGIMDQLNGYSFNKSSLPFLKSFALGSPGKLELAIKLKSAFEDQTPSVFAAISLSKLSEPIEDFIPVLSDPIDKAGEIQSYCMSELFAGLKKNFKFTHFTDDEAYQLLFYSHK